MNQRYIETETHHTDSNGVVAVVWLNRPERRNALNCGFVRELHAAIEEINRNADIRVVVLMGKGSVFCAGADLADEYAEDIHNAEELIEQLYKPLFTSIITSNKIFIAGVTGAAVGAGASLALACDITLMSEEAKLVFAFTSMALVPDCGASWMLARHMGYKNAFRVIVEGQALDARQCLSSGLCNEIVGADDIPAASLKLAAKMATRAPLAVRLAKQLLLDSTEKSFLEMISAEAKAQRQCESSADFQEAKSAFFEKRQPVFYGR